MRIGLGALGLTLTAGLHIPGSAPQPMLGSRRCDPGRRRGNRIVDLGGASPNSLLSNWGDSYDLW
jgi:hypothetical protein